MATKKNKGFTLLELLIVIAILAVLATTAVLVINPNETLKKARSAQRLNDLRAIEDAVIHYAAANGGYPSTSGGIRSECSGWGGYTATTTIPGLVPTYLAKLPADPRMDTVTNKSCYLYRSDGTDYKIFDIDILENSASDYLKYPEFIDPTRDGGSDGCVIDGATPRAWVRYSAGGTCW